MALLVKGDTDMFTLAESGYTLYGVVVPRDAAPAIRYAAEELAHFLSDITGAYFAIQFYESKHEMPHSLYVGCESAPALSAEEYAVRSDAKCALHFTGGSPRGVLYGVYAFLEELLGCRWYTPNCSLIPKRGEVTLENVSLSGKPALEYREPYYGNAYDGDWSARNRANGHFNQLYTKHGGQVKYHKNFVHTFNKLIPVEEYFETHPEYFSEVDGVRISEQTQLCLTNPDVLRLCIARVFEWIREDPDATIISVSQNDWYNPCQCPACRAIDEAEGSHAGTLIRFVNQIAEAVEEKYPHIAIDTLAYQYTRPAPKLVRPRPNVIVRLCSIECCFSHPLESCDAELAPFEGKVEGAFRKDLQDWAKQCDRIYIWDYVTNFSHYCFPFPNWDVLQPNIRFLHANSVKGIFEQGTYALGGGPDFNELRTWLLAKLLWNPDFDVEAGTREFLYAYYGRAAAPLQTYLCELRAMAKSVHFSIFSVIDIGYMPESFVARAEALFAQADALAENDTIRLRVRRAALCLRFVRIARAVEAGTAKKKEIDAFFDAVERAGLTRVSEWRTLQEDRELWLSGKTRTW